MTAKCFLHEKIDIERRNPKKNIIIITNVDQEQQQHNAHDFWQYSLSLHLHLELELEFVVEFYARDTWIIYGIHIHRLLLNY